MCLKRGPVVILVSIVLFLLMCVMVSSVSESKQRLFEMFFHRTFVQFASTYVFALVITLLGKRFTVYLQAKRQLQKAHKEKLLRAYKKFVLPEDMNIIRKHFIEHGREGVLLCLDQLVKHRKDKIHKAYEMINFLVCCLPALGLFGTMLGLSASLFTAFAAGNVGPDAVKNFVTALGTALDTTVLALGFALIVGGLAWFINHLENELGERQANFLSKVFLNKIASKSAEKKTADLSSPALSSLTSAFRAELRALTADIVENGLVKFDERLRDVAGSYRLGLESAVDKIFRQQREHEQAMVEKVASHLIKSVDHIGVLIKKHNNDSLKTVTSRLRHIAGTLDKRIAGELVIRYERNGRFELENNNDT